MVDGSKKLRPLDQGWTHGQVIEVECIQAHGCLKSHDAKVIVTKRYDTVIGAVVPAYAYRCAEVNRVFWVEPKDWQ